MVEFQSVADPSPLTTGAIRPDGTFTLTTLVGGKKLPGAVAGRHRVTVLPPQAGDQSTEPIEQPRSEYVVEPRADNTFTIVIGLAPGH